MKSINDSLCVILASHNRKKQTLTCLDRLETASRQSALVTVRVFLVEDGSVDGTEEAVRVKFPEVCIIQGNGKLFWNGAMRKGLGCAIEEGHDYYMLLNDDTLIVPDAINRMITAHQELEDRRAIIVGTVVDPHSKEVTYGGRLRSCRWHPLRFEGIVTPSPFEVQPCDTINGNCVLIPSDVVNVIGNLSPSFVHVSGDFDYGLRAKKKGIKLLVAPGYVGTCVRDRSPNQLAPFSCGPMKDLWSFATHPKKRPLKERIAYYRRHGGIFWWVLVPGPYLRRAFMNVRRGWRKRGHARGEN